MTCLRARWGSAPLSSACRRAERLAVESQRRCLARPGPVATCAWPSATSPTRPSCWGRWVTRRAPRFAPRFAFLLTRQALYVEVVKDGLSVSEMAKLMDQAGTPGALFARVGSLLQQILHCMDQLRSGDEDGRCFRIHPFPLPLPFYLRLFTLLPIWSLSSVPSTISSRTCAASPTDRSIAACLRTQDGMSLMRRWTLRPGWHGSVMQRMRV